MTKDEALKLALEALERYQVKRQDFDRFADEITAIKQALEQPAQEPVAWMDKYGELYKEIEHALPTDKPLYTTAAQRQWVGLTDEEVKHMLELFVIPPHHVAMVVRAIEAKLRSKNG